MGVCSREPARLTSHWVEKGVKLCGDEERWLGYRLFSIRRETLMWSQSGRVCTLVGETDQPELVGHPENRVLETEALKVAQEHNTINQLYSSKT